jgi:FkbM family methyltransferase
VLASAACGAKSVAIEPDPGTAKSLRHNIELNKLESKVRVAETAVGERQGSIRFTVGLDTMNKVSTEGNDATSRVVPLTTLDRVFEGSTPVMLKLDVEGFEGISLHTTSAILAKSMI